MYFCEDGSFTELLYLSQGLISEFQLAEGLFVFQFFPCMSRVFVRWISSSSPAAAKHTNDLSNATGRDEMAFQYTVNNRFIYLDNSQRKFR